MGNNLTRLAAKDHTSILKITKMRFKRGNVSHPRSQLFRGAGTPGFYLLIQRLFEEASCTLNSPTHFTDKYFLCPRRGPKHLENMSKNITSTCRHLVNCAPKSLPLCFYDTRAKTAQTLLKGSKTEMGFSYNNEQERKRDVLEGRSLDLFQKGS